MAKPDSTDTQGERDQTPAHPVSPITPHIPLTLDEIEAGDNRPTGESGVPETDASRAKALSASVMKRLKAEKRWFGQIDLVRDQMMRESKEAFPDLVQRQLWVYAELDRMYPSVQYESGGASEVAQGLTATKQIRISSLGDQAGSDSGQIHGLAEIPEGWPGLPANASLAAEIGWVQANRLFMVEERPGRATRVRLDQAASPAPSRAALGWLETSIRSYAKFVDVAAKVSGSDEGDEGAVVRAERRSTDEVRALLREMEEAEGCCPSCGKPF